VGVGGGSGLFDVNGVPVFAKQVPLTDLELAHPHSTANLFDLPLYCQYGIGSPGFSGWRELAANMIVTDGVVSGEAQSFALLYHWRVLPGRPVVAAEHEDIEAAVAALDGSRAVRARLEALAAASHSLVLFLEYLPYPLPGRLGEGPVDKAEAVQRQLFEISAFLRGRELLHMDGHFGNMRTDGDRIYLVDSGWPRRRASTLSSAERAFIDRNATHDAGYAAMMLVNWLVTAVCGVAVPESGGPVARNEYVRRCAAGHIPSNVPPAVAAILARHAAAATRLNGFYWRLFGGEVHAQYPGLSG
jgi:hypothetical protein